MAAAKDDFASSQTRGALVVAGGCMAHFILGTMYCWGNFLTYAPDSLLFLDGLAHPGLTPAAVQVMPIALMALAVGLPVGAMANKKIGARKTSMIGCALMVLGVCIAARTRTLVVWRASLLKDRRFESLRGRDSSRLVSDATPPLPPLLLGPLRLRDRHELLHADAGGVDVVP